MKGDFSRQTFDPRRHYDGVLMQQGRVQLDADWNEQDAISRYRDEKEAVDVIGRCGAPLHAAGFGITTDGSQLFIGQGRYWVDGILVENDLGELDYDQPPPAAPLAFDAQPYLPGVSLAALLSAIQEEGAAGALVYLDVWQRHVTALEDGRLREVALGGPDTTTRVQTVWQVKLLAGGKAGDNDPQRGKLLGQRTALQADLAGIDPALAQLTAQIAELEAKIAVTRSPATLAKLKAQQDKLTAEHKDLDAKQSEVAAALAELDKKLAALDGRGGSVCGDVPGWDDLARRSGLLNARAQPADPSDDPCELPPGGGYTRLENQLYRVEIHRGGALGTATFKWSRDNGTVVAAIEQISGSTVRVDTLGPDDVLGFANGQWVELLDDRVELSGVGGQLAKITDINPATRELTLDPTPVPLAAGADGIDPDLHPRVRRWEQTGATATTDGVLTGVDWLALEDGVEVQFTQPAGTIFAPGDYWTIPARTATADLDWPPFETPNLNPVAQTAFGIEHHFCRLALVTWNGEELEVVEDCRELFPPLTEICCTRTALHVTAINWENDAVNPATVLTNPGLRITLDAAPDPASVSNESVLLTYDFPFRMGDATVPFMFQRLVIRGTTVGVDPADPKTIVWRFQEANVNRTNDNTGDQPAPGGGAQPTPGGGTVGGGGLGGVLRPPIVGGILDPGLLRPRDVSERAIAPGPNQFRLNLTLRGSFIWRTERRKRIYLDGQTLGVPAAVAGTSAARTDLDLPSGDGRRASDFESWFYIGTGRQTQPLQITAVTFRTTFGAAPRDVLTVKEFTTDPAHFEQIQSNDAVNVVVIEFNRDVNPQGNFAGTAPAPVHLQIGRRAGMFRLFGDLTVKGNQAQYIAREPEVFKEPGEYRIMAFAEQGDAAVPLAAQDDGTTLDGDFDGQSGNNFVLNFRVS